MNISILVQFRVIRPLVTREKFFFNLIPYKKKKDVTLLVSATTTVATDQYSNLLKDANIDTVIIDGIEFRVIDRSYDLTSDKYTIILTPYEDSNSYKIGNEAWNALTNCLENGSLVWTVDFPEWKNWKPDEKPIDKPSTNVLNDCSNADAYFCNY